MCHPRLYLVCSWSYATMAEPPEIRTYGGACVPLTLSAPTASYNGRIPSGTPQGRAQKVHIFPQGSNNENELQYLVHFIHPEFLEIYYYSIKFRVRECNNRMKRTSIDNIQGFVCAHQKNPSHNGYSSSCTYNRGK